MKILSTKKLKPNQRDLLLGSGYSVVDYNAITIDYIDFEIPAAVENAIFTSGNSVKAVLQKGTDAQFLSGTTAEPNCFCVGNKTKVLLEKNGQKVVKTAQYSALLGEYIVKNHQNDRFYYFCGSERRDELPNLLNAAEIDFFEIKTYQMALNRRKFEQKWDGILFFSPSGVQSFMLENSVGQATAFCIGNTTASEVRKHTPNIVVAKMTTVESVIAQTVAVLNNAHGKAARATTNKDEGLSPNSTKTYD